ncbi:MAG: efflux RND transporter permease subunit [Planctomycetes bacterium]|nr:efflux RND transporter permease subunit [Planctomycetota bacterium]
MFQRIIAFSLQRSAIVVVLAGVLLVFAGYALPRIPVDVFPELNAPTVVILTEAGGLAADEVESNVTFPIETSVNGLPGVRRVRSASAISLSIVWVEFDFGEDIYRARQLVSEKLSAVRESLPEEIHAEIAPVTSITGEIMLISISSAMDAQGTPRVSDLELRAYAEFDLRNRLLSVPGIANVVAIGGELPEYQVNVKQDRLALYGLTVGDVADAARRAHATMGAGYLPNVDGLELPLRQTGRVQSVDDIKRTMIRKHEGATVTIGDVADVVLAGAPKRGAGTEAGFPAVVVGIQKNPGTNTLELTQRVDLALDDAEKAAPNGLRINRHVMRQADFINLSLERLTHVLVEAAIFVAVLLVLFLMNVRTTLITLTALPLSLAVALLLLWAMGLNINVMTLGGLAVAIGELVDDAIIDVENVFRRLRENRALPDEQRKPHIRVVFDASNEIRSSVVFATIIICIVFVPLLFLGGLEGRFFRPLGLAYILSIMASLAVALTVTPALCKLLLRRAKGGHEHEGPLVRLLKRLYDPTLRLALKLKWALPTAALIASAASLWFAGTFGTRFLPDFNEGTFTVFLMAPPGTSLDESVRLARGVELQLAEIPGVNGVVGRTGRAERDEHAEPASSTEIEVGVKPGFHKEDVRREIDKVLASIPGITTMVGQPIEHRLSHILSGTPAALAINVYGDDLPTLRKIAKEVEAAIQAVPGARDITANREIMIDTVPISYRHADLARFGLTPVTAAEQVEAAISGIHAAEINQGARRFAMFVRLAPEERATPAQIRDLVLVGKGGTRARLWEVADIGVESASNLIARDNARRKAAISCNVAEGYNLGDLVRQVREKVDPIVNKYGYSVHYGGQFEAQQSASQTILVMGAGAILAIFFLLYMALGNWRSAALVMLNLPLALIGGVVAVYLTATRDVLGNTLALLGVGGRYIAPVISIASMVGFVTLFGIAVRNGILLVAHYQHLMRDGMDRRQAILQGSKERLVPILMTALAAVLGLIPLALAAGEPGSELLAPLAVVVLGGLVTSTFLNLVVVPAAFSLFGPKEIIESKTEKSGL